MIIQKIVLSTLILSSLMQETLYGMNNAEPMDIGEMLSADERSDAQGFYMLISTRANCEALKASFLASPYSTHIDTTATTLPEWHTEDQDPKLLNFFFGHLASRYCGQCLFGPKPAEIRPLLKCFLTSLFAKQVDLNVRCGTFYVLTKAAKNGDSELIKLLTDAGADIHLKTPEEDMETAFVIARNDGNEGDMQSKRKK